MTNSDHHPWALADIIRWRDISTWSISGKPPISLMGNTRWGRERRFYDLAMALRSRLESLHDASS